MGELRIVNGAEVAFGKVDEEQKVKKKRKLQNFGCNSSGNTGKKGVSGGGEESWLNDVL